MTTTCYYYNFFKKTSLSNYFKALRLKPDSNHKIWIKFSDGVEGTFVFSELVGKGVFKAWEDINFFNSLYIDQESHTIAWKDGIDLCPDNLYAKVLGFSPLSVLKKEVAINY